jgi:hypothetical protein
VRDLVLPELVPKGRCQRWVSVASFPVIGRLLV